MHPRASARQSSPVTVATVAWIVAGLPALLGAALAVAYLWSFVTGTGVTLKQVLTFGPILAAFAGAVGTYILLRRRTAAGSSWLWAVLTVALLLLAAAPAVVGLGGAFLSEWCEAEPGGRGYYGPLTSPDDIPVLCR